MQMTPNHYKNINLLAHFLSIFDLTFAPIVAVTLCARITLATHTTDVFRWRWVREARPAMAREAAGSVEAFSIGAAIVELRRATFVQIWL